MNEKGGPFRSTLKRMQGPFAQIFGDAKAQGLSSSFDPNSDPSHLWRDSIREVFASTDLLFLNETERCS